MRERRWTPLAIHCAVATLPALRRSRHRRLVPALYLWALSLPAGALVMVVAAGLVAKALRWAVAFRDMGDDSGGRR